MDLDVRKIQFIQEFLRLQNEEIVIHLEKLLYQCKAEQLEKEMNVISINQLNKEIDQAINDSENGRLISASDLQNSIKKWQ